VCSALEVTSRGGRVRLGVRRRKRRRRRRRRRRSRGWKRGRITKV